MCEKLSTQVFRSVFRVVAKDHLHWFPGHMGKGLKQMQQKLRSVDCVIEVHDARIPISGRNANFKYTISGVKPHILVLNKVDMIPPKLIPDVKKKLKDEYENVIFTNCKIDRCPGVEKLFPLVQKLIRKSDRYNRSEEEDLSVMIIGIPNVGKSSLINSLRNKFLRKANATPVGAVPGITRSVLTKIKISEDPLCYLLDTPGILTPSVPSTEVGLKLALCNTIKDHLVGETIIADYLLYWLNKNQYFNYVKFFGLTEPQDNILEVLTQISLKHNKVIRIRSHDGYVQKPDLQLAAQFMIKSFRGGNLGKIILDGDLIL